MLKNCVTQSLTLTAAARHSKRCHSCVLHTASASPRAPSNIRTFSQTSVYLARKQAFKVLNGDIDATSSESDVNFKFNKALEQKFTDLLGIAEGGGGEKGRKRHAAHGKCSAADRLQMLLDEDGKFMELSALAGMNMEYGSIPRAGMIAGIGKVNGVQCVITANDASVKGGTIFPIGVTKQLRAQEIALQNRLPFIFIVDSGGGFLPLQADLFPDKNHGGRSFYSEAIMSSKAIPQLAIVCGSCTAGGAYVPAMCQESVIIKRIGHVFLGGPPLVKAAVGEDISADDLGGAQLHCSVSGVTDHYADTETEGFEIGRDVVASFNVPEARSNSGYDEPLYPVEDMARLIPRKNQHHMDMYKVLARLTDGSRFQEFKTRYGTSLVTGFGHIHGHLVGIVGNNGELSAAAGAKGSHFVQICEERKLPIIFLQNTNLPNSADNGEESGEILKGLAKMIATVSCSTVPKITVIVGDSIGSGNYAMCGRAFEPRFLFLWPNARVAISDPEELLTSATQKILSDESQRDTEEGQKKLAKVTEKVKFESSSLYSSSRMHDDGVILPHHTRKVLGQCLDIIVPTIQQDANNYSVIRM